MALEKLSAASKSASAQLTQPEREAIVDVLHVCMYADSHIALSEDEVIEKIARSFAWDPKISYDSYEAKSVGAVRRALGDARNRAEFFADVRTRLPKGETRQLALELAEQVFKADGNKSTRESEVAAELKKILLAP